MCLAEAQRLKQGRKEEEQSLRLLLSLRLCAKLVFASLRETCVCVFARNLCLRLGVKRSSAKYTSQMYLSAYAATPTHFLS